MYLSQITGWTTRGMIIILMIISIPASARGYTSVNSDTRQVSRCSADARRAAARRDLRGRNRRVRRGRSRGVTRSPLPVNMRLSSHYGTRPGRRSGRPTFHAGIDFQAPRGTPVFAVRAGIVERVVYNRQRRNGFAGYGNAVVVYHEDEDIWTFYAHLDAVVVNEGDMMFAGAVLGRVGNTNNRRFRGMGVHLHFEVRQRAANGDSPFPGAYRRNNRNPERWLARHGVRFDRRGQLIYHAPTRRSRRLVASTSSNRRRHARHGRRGETQRMERRSQRSQRNRLARSSRMTQSRSTTSK